MTDGSEPSTEGGLSHSKQRAVNATAAICNSTTSAAAPPSLLNVHPNDNNELIVTGMVVETDDASELKRDFRRHFAKTLRVSVRVVNVTKLKHDLFIIELSRYIEKLAVLANRDVLLNFTVPIHVYSEKFELDKLRRRQIHRIARFETERGSTVVVTGDNITVNGYEWTWDPEKRKIVKHAASMCNSTWKQDTWGVRKTITNIVVLGLDLKDWEGDKLKRKLEDYFRRTIGVSTTVKSAKRLRRILCILELQNVEDKIKILKYRHALDDSVYIYGDRAKRERIIVEALAQKAEQELAKGRSINIQYLRLYVEGVVWAWRDDKQMLVKEFDNRPEEAVDHAEIMERRRRKHNIIVQGLWIKSDDQEQIKLKLERLFEDVFEMHFPIKSVTKLNNALFLVKLDYFRDKVYILKNKKRLVQGEYTFNPVVVYNDLTAVEKYISNRISQRARGERKRGNTVRVGYMRLYINDQKWVWSRVKNDLVPR